MKRLLFISLALTASVRPAPAADAKDDVATAARNVFRARCAGCHGPDLPKPKGRFGYVLDLRRIAANPDLVIPGKPDESELWELIRRNEMPPSAPLTAEQKDVVREWILAGAPPAPAATEGAAADTGASHAVRRILRAVGRLHLLLLHFPIALFVVAAASELWSAARGRSDPGPGVRLCMLTGAPAAVVTAVLGWAYAAGGAGTGAEELLAWHRWLGTAAAGWAVAAALVFEREVRRGNRGRAARFMVVIGAILIGAAAHFGGLLVHGDFSFAW